MRRFSRLLPIRKSQTPAAKGWRTSHPPLRLGHDGRKPQATRLRHRVPVADQHPRDKDELRADGVQKDTLLVPRLPRNLAHVKEAHPNLQFYASLPVLERFCDECILGRRGSGCGETVALSRKAPQGQCRHWRGDDDRPRCKPLLSPQHSRPACGADQAGSFSRRLLEHSVCMLRPAHVRLSRRFPYFTIGARL